MPPLSFGSLASASAFWIHCESNSAGAERVWSFVVGKSGPPIAPSRRWNSRRVSKNDVGYCTTHVRCQTVFGNTNDRNIAAVNTTCLSMPDFGPTMTCLWSHEQQHLDSAKAAAKRPENDVYKAWEPPVANDSAALNFILHDAYVAAVETVGAVALSAHNGMTQQPLHTIWDNTTGQQWFKYSFYQNC